jgi:hypothetical protein
MEYEELKRRLVWNQPPKSLEAEPPTIKQILYDPYPCPDCDKILDDKRVITQNFNVNNGVWTKKCEVCKFHQNPDTGAYDCDIHERNAILAHNKRKKGK